MFFPTLTNLPLCSANQKEKITDKQYCNINMLIIMKSYSDG